MLAIIKFYKHFSLILVLTASIGIVWHQWEQMHSLRNVLRHAYLIEIIEPGAETQIQSVSVPEAIVAQLSPGYVIYYDAGTSHMIKRNSSLLAELKECTNVHSQPLGRNATYAFNVYTILGQRTVIHYDYNLTTGELGKNQEWCYLPENIKMWINRLPAPSRDIVQTTNYKDFSVTQKVN